jgi:hypothetical protein
MSTLASNGMSVGEENISVRTSKERLLRGQEVINVGQQGSVSRFLTSSKTITEDKRGNMLNSSTCGAARLK